MSGDITGPSVPLNPPSQEPGSLNTEIDKVSSHQHRKVSSTKPQPTAGLKSPQPAAQTHDAPGKKRRSQVTGLSVMIQKASSIEELARLRGKIASLKPERQEALSDSYAQKMERLIGSEMSETQTPSELLDLSNAVSEHLPNPRARRRLHQSLFTNHVKSHWDTLKQQRSDPAQRADLVELLESMLEKSTLKTFHREIESYLEQLDDLPELEEDTMDEVYRVYQQQVNEESGEETLEIAEPESAPEYNMARIQMQNQETYPFTHTLEHLKELTYPDPFCRSALKFLEQCTEKAGSSNSDDLNLSLLRDMQAWIDTVVENPKAHYNLQAKLLDTAVEVLDSQLQKTRKAEAMLDIRDQFEKMLQDSPLPIEETLPVFQDACQRVDQYKGEPSDHWNQRLSELNKGHGSLLSFASLVQSTSEATSQYNQLETFLDEKVTTFNQLQSVREEIEERDEPDSITDLSELWALADHETECLKKLHSWTENQITQCSEWLKA